MAFLPAVSEPPARHRVRAEQCDGIKMAETHLSHTTPVSAINFVAISSETQVSL